ncbi:MAG: hypothetical protein ABI615_11690, partial [Chthoniobacterales bacterium]
DITKGLSRFDTMLHPPVAPQYSSAYYLGGILKEEQGARYINKRTTRLEVTRNGASMEIMLPDDTLCIVSPAPTPPRGQGAQFGNGIYARIEFCGENLRTTDTQIITYPDQYIILRSAKRGVDGRPAIVLLQINRSMGGD